MQPCLIAAAVLALMLPQTPTGQSRDAELTRVMAQLQLAVDALRPNLSPPGLAPAVKWLRGRSTQTNENVSEEYVRSLQRAAVLLAGNPTPEVIDDVTSELEAKVDHCRTLGIGMGGSVVLRVSTRRGPQTVSDWQVFYLLKIYEHVSTAAPVTFPALSTPTETRLDPGRYWLWARDPSTGRTSERTLIRVAGQTAFQVDLPVP
jgi:hypothetical protein